MEEILEKIRDEYLIEIKEEFKNNSLATYVRRKAPTEFTKFINLDDRYLVKGSVGQGNWAEIPWISIFDKDITTSAMKGFYIVYLFSSDMKKVYLSLNQGYTYFKHKYKRKESFEKIHKVSLTYRNLLINDIEKFDSFNISLNSKNDLAIGYEKGHICGIEYDLYNLPKNENLISDLKKLIPVYLKLKILLENNLNYSKNLDNLLYIDDNTFDTDEDSLYLSIIKEEPNNYINDLPKEKSSKNNTSIGGYKRDKQVAINSLYLANYNCEFDNSHKFFISRRNQSNYVEAHHLIPMKFQDEFVYSIDIEANVIALCPICHKILHHGTPEKIEPILKKLYKKRIKRLNNCNINISYKKLLSYYGINKLKRENKIYY